MARNAEGQATLTNACPSWGDRPQTGWWAMICGDGTIIQTTALKARAFSLRCKRWGCRYCQPLRRKRLVALAASGQPTTFLTLTSNPSNEGYPLDHARALVAGWRELHKRIKKTFRYDRLDYLVVMEATKLGEPHLHILLRAKYIPQKWISAQWEQITGAPIVDIRRIDGQQGAAAYVSKYVGKQPHHFGTMKRYYRSQKWDLRPKLTNTKQEWANAVTVEVNIQCHKLAAWWLQVGQRLAVASRDYLESEGPPLKALPTFPARGR